MRNLKTLAEKVKFILTEAKSCQDDDTLLYAAILMMDGYNTKEMSAEDMLVLMSIGTIPKYEAVTRARRKVQELNPLLRGKKYRRRIAEQDIVKDQISSIK